MPDRSVTQQIQVPTALQSTIGEKVRLPTFLNENRRSFSRDSRASAVGPRTVARSPSPVLVWHHSAVRPWTTGGTFYTDRHEIVVR